MRLYFQGFSVNGRQVFLFTENIKCQYLKIIGPLGDRATETLITLSSFFTTSTFCIVSLLHVFYLGQQITGYQLI